MTTTDGQVLRETTFLAVVRRCLGDDEIGLEDNFYAVGGDSILALQVIADAAEAGLEVNLIDLLARETLAEIAARVVTASAPTAPSGRGPDLDGLDGADLARPPVGAAAVQAASALQVGLVLLSEMSDQSRAYLDFIGVQVRPALNEKALRAALTALARRHSTLRCCLDLAAYSTAVQVIWPAVDVPLDIEEAGSAATERSMIDAWRDRVLAEGIAWDRAPAFRCHVLAAPEHFWLSFAAHHSFIDGWSYARLVIDLLTFYDAELAGVPADLPPVPTDGHEAFLRLELQAVASAESAAYWSAQVQALPEVEWSRRGSVADASQMLRLPIGSDRWDRLKLAAAELRVPVKSLCLGAYAAALGRWRGQESVVTGLVTSGRPEIAGADHLVGLYLNTVPLRLAAAGDDRARLAASALAAERRMTPHRRYPLERIENLLGRPSFDVAFNFTHFHALRELDRLTRVRAEAWWSRDRATFPMLVNVFVDDPELGTGATVEFDPSLIDPPEARCFVGLFDSALASAAAR